MKCRAPQDAEWSTLEIGNESQRLIVIDDFLEDPAAAVDAAALQKFARINPHYPGVRAAVPATAVQQWLVAWQRVLGGSFAEAGAAWAGPAWFSIVTSAPQQLSPLQRFPHTDGTDAHQIALMLYLHTTPHGGTAFYRHHATGFETLNPQRFPIYQRTLEAEVQRAGLPPARYPGTAAPHFDHVHTVEGRFNRAVFYRGNAFHTGVIDEGAPLSGDPRAGRLTINGFFHPQDAAGTMDG